MCRVLSMILRKSRAKTLFASLIKISIIFSLTYILIQLKRYHVTKSLSPIKLPNTMKPKNIVKPKTLTSCKLNSKYLQSNVVEFHDVTLHPELAIGVRKGGEEIYEVKGQSEMDEYFIFKTGFLNVSCVGKSNLKSDFKQAKHRFQLRTTYTSDIIYAVDTSTHTGNGTGYKDSIAGLTVGIVRTDYANMYWTAIEVYSAYMSAREMNKSSKETTILLMDAHPRGHLDALWRLMFKDVIRMGWMDKTTHLEDFALVPPLKLVPIVRKSLPIPYLDEFRDDVIRLGGGSPFRKTNCKHLTISLVLRKDYIAHPRSVEGKIKRKLENSEAIVIKLQESLPNDTVGTVTFEELSVQEQIGTVTETDILIGVHGAGLAHTLFQVPKTGLIEIFPYEYRRIRNPHFEELAQWSGKLYASWYSSRASDAINVPPEILIDKVTNMKKEMCKID